MLLLILIHHKSYQETQLHITANGGSGRYVASELSRHFKIDVTVTHRHKEKTLEQTTRTTTISTRTGPIINHSGLLQKTHR